MRSILAISLGILLLGVGTGRAEPADDRDEAASERSIDFDRLPEPVQEVVLAAADPHEVLEVEELTYGDGTVTYEATWLDGEDEVEIEVDADGNVLAREVEPRSEDEEDEGEAPDDR
jgi:hypothetical protein